MEGFSLSGLKGESAKWWTQKDIEAKLRRQSKKEGKLKGLMKILKPLASKGVSGLLKRGLLNTIVPPWLFPFVQSGVSSIFSKWTEEGLRKHAKMGADPSKITSESKYGHGEEYAKMLSEELHKEISDTSWSPETLAQDIGQSYIDKYTPKIDADGNVIYEDSGYDSKADLRKSYMGTVSDLDYSSEYESSLASKKPSFLGGLLEEAKKAFTIVKNPFEEQVDYPINELGELESPIHQSSIYQSGGLVPSESPTISEYFNMKGVSLGGSNKKSLSEMLGRK